MDEFYRVPLSSGEALATLAALRALRTLTKGEEGILTDVDTQIWETAADRVAEALPDFVSVQADRLGAALAAALREGFQTQTKAFSLVEREKPPLPIQRTRVILENAQLRDRPVEIHYYVKSREEWTTRRVDDVEVYEDGDSWYLAGHCGLRDEHRLFRLDHIGAVRIIGDARKDPEEASDEPEVGKKAVGRQRRRKQ